MRLDCYILIIEHRNRNKHQKADSLSKKTEFYEIQEQRKGDRPQINDGLLFMDNETYGKFASQKMARSPKVTC